MTQCRGGGYQDGVEGPQRGHVLLRPAEGDGGEEEGRGQGEPRPPVRGHQPHQPGGQHDHCSLPHQCTLISTPARGANFFAKFCNPVSFCGSADADSEHEAVVFK